MTPLPKKKASSRRQGKRRAALERPKATVSTCKHCNTPKEAHMMCKNCGQY